MRIGSIADLERLRESLAERERARKHYIVVCGGTGCRAYGSPEVVQAFREELKGRGLEEEIVLKVTGCHGFCERGVLVLLYPEGVFYQRVKPEDVPEIVDSRVNGSVVDRLLYEDPQTGERISHWRDIPFYRKQHRLIFGTAELLDPMSIEDYIAIGGYSSLAKSLLKMRPEEVIEEVKRSGLRGRGGGGFPTGVKWEVCRNAFGDEKFVVCNADEGDPGAYMDRSLIERNPHAVLEGMTIGAYAIGANQGYIYIRYEYPLALSMITAAIGQAKEYGLLGDNILGSGFSFRVKIVRGGGAFVCGEATALVASIEGRVGEPRSRPPHLAEKGLWGKPTVINNVETWANVPIIIDKGWEWFSKIGTEGSKGTKIFSLVGKVNNTGLIEVPMGISLREIIFDIGGGIRGGKKFKAVQTGGPSGGVIPEKLLDLPIDFDSLTEVGSMMGSGGMIVMDEDTCMVDIARYFLNFLREESCGKCTPCREGIKAMLEIINRIVEGKGEEEDIDTLLEISEVMKEASLCGLGTTAPNPVLSTIEYFRDEYEAHIREKRCPAGVCKALITFRIDPDKCTGCGACAKPCPQGAISGEKKQPYTIDQEKCIKCGICRDICRFDAITRE